MNNEHNGLVEPEIIPDFENEMIEDAPQQSQESGGCGCGKNKGKTQNSDPQKSNALMWGGLAVLGLVIMYFVFKKKGGNNAPITE
tara:strand:- start:1131 stop:1385 length:255 start_codon:yes stop_codon:yes gene_type:complete